MVSVQLIGLESFGFLPIAWLRLVSIQVLVSLFPKPYVNGKRVYPS